MCGFAGEFLFGPGRADPSLAARMAAALAHRGPDEQAAWTSPDGRCAIAFRRLAVIDPAGSHQPMTSADGRLTVAFNGEIYNFRDLTRRLVADGAAFSTRGDTEALLHLYQRHGSDLVNHLDGMFAFVLYDSAASTLLLARDRLGEKPLWYAPLADRIVFASESVALLRHPSVPRALDPQAITFYLSVGYIPSPRSVWTAVRKMPPACVMTISDGPTEPRRYWRLAVAPLQAPTTDLVEQTRAQVAAAVEARMYADVPLGALLSGGIDSSIVVALMARVAGKAGGIRTYTAGFDAADYDERPAARLVAEHAGTDHTELVVRPAVAEALDHLVAMYGEPFADSSALPTWLICRAARRHVTVALVGDGGDEVFAGYDRYRALRLAETMRPHQYLAAVLTAFLVRPFAPHHERSRLRRLIRFASSLSQPFALQYFMIRSLFGAQDLPRLLTAEFADGLDLAAPGRWFTDLYEEGDFDSEVTRAQHHDLATYLPDDLLVKADIASMAASLELRCPMLDHRVVAQGLSLPVEMKVSTWRGKEVLRSAFADLLPPEVFRRPKRGFGVPLARWLREDLFETLRGTLMDPGLHRRGIFRPEALTGLLNDHFSGRGDHSHRLWALLVLARWLALRGDP